jgi:hypothetical protein
MWLPGPLYESLPYLYILGGVLFICGAFYIGDEAPGAMLYAGCGLITILYGAFVFKLRFDRRKKLNQTGYIELG